MFALIPTNRLKHEYTLYDAGQLVLSVSGLPTGIARGFHVKSSNRDCDVTLQTWLPRPCVGRVSKEKFS